MLRATFRRPDLQDPAMGERWTTLARAWNAPVFRSWTWVGCLAVERYPDPLLAEVHDGTTLVGLALFNRGRDRTGRALHLHESGDLAQDAVFIEHNGMLAARDDEARVLDAILRAARPHAARVVLPGVDDAALAAARRAGGIVSPLQTRLAPFARLDRSGPDYVQSLSRNTRAQLRRSDRAYQVFGPLRVERADTIGNALDWLDCLLVLHVATWVARGQVSGFAADPVQRFSRELVRRGVDDGTVDLLRVSAGPRVVGYLMNLRDGQRVSAYQSGFDYARAPEHAKPGVTCHAASVRRAIAGGATEYDFLAGDAQYKRSLSHDVRAMHWLGWQPVNSFPGLVALARTALRR